MPYLKFASKEEREKARNIEMDLAEKNGRKVQGLVAVINDSNYGIVDFYSEKPYMDLFKGLNFQVIPREQISAPYADFLRYNYPTFLNEL